jgi:hypothetical protein
MDTSRAHEGYQQNVPESVLHQIQLLHAQQKRIVELEVELRRLRENRTQLERDLEPYRIGAPFADITPVQRIPMEPVQVESARIHRCPDEILCMIFENCVLLPFHHLYIRRLVLVCRRWYTLVTNTVKLWARIEISSPCDLLDIGSEKSQFSYIVACLRRSKNLQITVDLDLEDLICANYIAQELSGHAKNIVDEVHHNSIVRSIDSVEWYDFTSAKFEAKVERFFEWLAGVDGEHIRRWGTLTLRLPNWPEALGYWNRLAGGFKGIQEVTIHQYPLFPPDNPVIPDFTTVKYFKLTSVEEVEKLSITNFGLSPSTLEHLHIEVISTSIALRELSQFQQLQTLELVCIRSSSYQRRFCEGVDISLPRLMRLTLSGAYHILAHLSLDFPFLDLLTVHVQGYDGPLPAIAPRHIRWSTESGNNWWLQQHTKDPQIERKQLAREFILLSDVLECITIEDPEKDRVVEVVSQCKLEGKAPSLTQIVVEHKNGNVERIQV